MSSSTNPPGKTTANRERRTGADRRKEDKGSPKGLRDRRLSVEPRKPDVQELDLSASDWAALDSEQMPLAPKKHPPD